MTFRGGIVLGCVLLSLGPMRCLAQSCTASATANAFGTYQPMSGSAATTTAAVTVVCNPGAISVFVSYSLQLGAGSGGSFANRRMTSGTAHLQYQVYRDTMYSQIWGDGTSGTYTVADSYTLGIVTPINRSYTAYARAPAGQNAAVGSYGDTLMVLLTY